MKIAIEELNECVDLIRCDSYFSGSHAQRVVFLTEAQRLIGSLLNAELEQFIETEIANTSEHSQ